MTIITLLQMMKPDGIREDVQLSPQQGIPATGVVPSPDIPAGTGHRYGQDTSRESRP